MSLLIFAAADLYMISVGPCFKLLVLQPLYRHSVSAPSKFSIFSVLYASVHVIHCSGKIFGAIATLETLSTSVGSAVFNFGIYPATVDFYPGLSILIAAQLLFIPLVLVMLVYKIMQVKLVFKLAFKLCKLN